MRLTWRFLVERRGQEPRALVRQKCEGSFTRCLRASRTCSLLASCEVCSSDGNISTTLPFHALPGELANRVHGIVVTEMGQEIRKTEKYDSHRVFLACPQSSNEPAWAGNDGWGYN